MRRILTLILDYILLLAIGTVFGFVIYLQFFESTCLVAGKNVTLTRDIIFYGIFKTLPVIYFLIPFGLMLYKVRHKSNPTATCVTYSVLCLLTWFLLFPFTLQIQKKVYNTLQTEEDLKSSISLTKDYFRTSNHAVYYFIHDSESGSADVVKLFDERTPKEHAKISTLDVSENSKFEKENSPFKDSIVKNSMTDIPFFLLKIFVTLRENASDAISNGYLAWCSYCTLGFALCALYAFIKMSKWRLINAFTILTLSSEIIFFNYFYFTSSALSFRKFMRSVFYDSGKFDFFINHHIEFPLMLINLSLGIIFVICGIIIAVLRKSEES